MKLFKTYKKSILIYLLLFFFICIAVFFKIAPYLIYNYYYLIGFDSGKYVHDLIYKSSSNINTLDLWVEPGLNTNLVVFQTLSDSDPITIYKFILPVIVSIFFILMIYVITKRITNSAIAGLFSAIYFSISVVFLNATFDSYYRQIFGTIIYMTFVYYAYIISSEHNYNYRLLFLLGVLGAGIIVTHRAITLLFVLTLGILGLLLAANKKYIHIKYLFGIFISSLLFSAIYWLSILSENIVVLKEATLASFAGKSGGNATIKKLTREDNQIFGYITSIPLSFLPFISLIYTTIKNRIALITPFTIVLILYIYFKASFSNRFLFNLEIFLSIIVGVYFYYLYKKIDKLTFITIFICIFIFGSSNALNESLNRRPYLSQKTESIKWIESNISPINSMIIAPDALSTILTEMGYNTTFYNYPNAVGSGLDVPRVSEEILANNCNGHKLVKNKFEKNIDVYVAFDMWNLGAPLPRVEKLISLQEWENCRYYERVYNGDSYIKAIYKLRKEFQ